MSKPDATSYKGQSALNALMSQDYDSGDVKSAVGNDDHEHDLYGTGLLGEPLSPTRNSTLGKRFLVPPFTVLDSITPWWRERSRGWVGLGMQPAFGGKVAEQIASLSQSEVGYETGTSIYDPVLCELIYRWFCPPEGTVLDPFCGGSVRGVVAASLRLKYVGFDLSQRQVDANYEQGRAIFPNGTCPDWRVGDSTSIAQLASDVDADLIFSCPPFWNLEIYSDDPKDLSAMDYPQFLENYRKIIAGSLARLKPNRFACFVVGDVRKQDGYYCGLVTDTIKAFEDAGAGLYNWGILVTATGSLPIRAGRAFAANRKLGKTHQDVLLFCNGDWKKAAEACANVE